MAAKVEDILIEQGATFRKTITVKDAAGVVINISSWTGRGCLKASALDAVSVADFSFDFSSGATGQVVFSLSATITGGIETTGTVYSKYTKLYYEVELEDASGVVYRAANGVANVSPSLTQ